MSEQLYNLAEAIDLCGKLKMLREMGCGIINIHEDSILLDVVLRMPALPP